MHQTPGRVDGHLLSSAGALASDVAGLLAVVADSATASASAVAVPPGKVRALSCDVTRLVTVVAGFLSGAGESSASSASSSSTSATSSSVSTPSGAVAVVVAAPAPVGVGVPARRGALHVGAVGARNVKSLGPSIVAVFHGKLDHFTLSQAPEALGMDTGLVDEEVLAFVVGGDEPEALATVEPLNLSGLLHLNFRHF